jgi:hypothetical protein
VGRVVGQTLASSPILGGAGALIGRGATALGGVVPQLQGTLRFLQGGAGASTTGLEGLGIRAASRVVPGAATGAGQAALSGDDIGQGSLTGAALGPAAGVLFDPIARAAQRLTGGYIPPDAMGNIPDIVQEKARQARLLMNEGVPVKASQISDDPLLQVTNAVTSRVPFAGSTANISDQADAFRRAAITRMGFDPAAAGQTIPSVATSSMLDAAGTRIGQQFDNLASRINGPAPASLSARLTQIENDLPGQLGANELPIIQRQINNIRQTLANNNGNLSGGIYQDLVGSSSPLGKLTRGSASPDVQMQASALRSAVNDAAMSLATPPDQLGWQIANQNYRAYRTLDDAVTAGKRTLGDFTPKDLLSATTRTSRAFGGSGSLDDLAQAAHSVLQPEMDAKGIGAAGAAAGAGAGVAAATALMNNPLVLTHPAFYGPTAGLLAASPLLQGFNRAGGPAALATATTGNQPRDIARALRLLTQSGVAASPSANLSGQ